MDDFLIIGKQLSYFEDINKTTSFQEILSPAIQQKFTPCSMDVYSHPARQGSVWFKINFSNHCDADAWLEFGTIAARYIDFYAPDSNGRYHAPILTGSLRGIKSKPYPVNTFWMPLSKAGDHSVKTYYIRIEEQTPFEAPLFIGTLQSLHKHKSTNDYLVAGYMGAIIIMLLYNAFIWLSTREKLYLIYILYLFCSLVVPPAQNSYPFMARIGNYEWWFEHFIFFVAVANSLVGLFAIFYLNLKTELPKIYRIMVVLIMSLLVMGTLNFFFPIGNLVNAFQVCIILLFSLCLFSGYYLLIRRRKQAFYYSLGWTFMIIFACIFIFTINGLLPYNSFTRNAVFFGIVLETWMFSLALGNRINVLKREKESTQQDMLYQAIENEKSIRDQKEELEKEVIKRTAEILNASKELRAVNKQLANSNEKLSEQTANLELVNATKDKFFSIIAHDLRNPFNTIFGFADLLAKNLDQYDKEKIKELLEPIRTSSKNTFTLLENLLTWSRMQTGEIEFEPGYHDIMILFQEAIESVESQARQKDIVINQGMTYYAEVFGDKNMITTILRNLLSNAIKFTHPGGVILLTASFKDDFCEISVKDNGVGITVQGLEKLFQVHNKINTKGTANERGTGLGLVLCKEFVQKQGGKIWANAKEGFGSEFSFTLPCKQS
ncbi:MAG: hypothetical protein HXX13_04665 [Bacteroidetes bacterium]|nr:hypothetical protein [Bacteroidota bacterium]